jgi:predicted dehydrogenase
LAVKVAVIGLGKMGVSHFAIANALEQFDVVAVCDASSVVGAAVQKISGVKSLTRFDDVLAIRELDAIIIATPTALHEKMIEQAVARGVHIFCEKPLTLNSLRSRELAKAARNARLVTQVGYHNRFIGTFIEFKRLLDLGALGQPRHFQAEAYGPVVTRPTKPTWRGKRGEGGGALLDYAAHPLNLLNWYAGPTAACSHALLRSVYSAGVEDEVYATLDFEGGATAQLSVNWSDSSHRKMTTRISAWGEGGKIYADRQEIQVYLTGARPIPPGYTEGWNVRYITSLTEPVSFYLRGEEYSAQLEYFAECVSGSELDGRNSFGAAAVTDTSIDMIVQAAGGADAVIAAPKPARSPGLLSGAFRRRA